MTGRGWTDETPLPTVAVLWLLVLASVGAVATAVRGVWRWLR